MLSLTGTYTRKTMLLVTLLRCTMFTVFSWDISTFDSAHLTSALVFLALQSRVENLVSSYFITRLDFLVFTSCKARSVQPRKISSRLYWTAHKPKIKLGFHPSVWKEKILKKL
jgi:hypothetical protein